MNNTDNYQSSVRYQGDHPDIDVNCDSCNFGGKMFDLIPDRICEDRKIKTVLKCPDCEDVVVTVNTNYLEG
jgi:hypothetical protein